MNKENECRCTSLLCIEIKAGDDVNVRTRAQNEVHACARSITIAFDR